MNNLFFFKSEKKTKKKQISNYKNYDSSHEFANYFSHQIFDVEVII